MALIDETDLIAPEEVIRQYPSTPEHRVHDRRTEVQKILDGRDRIRKLVIMGPCSAWPSPAVEEYMDRAAELQKTVNDHVQIVGRTYIQKPRTTVGWPGPLYQPNPQLPIDINQGILECRCMMSNVARQIGCADEMLFTHNGPYFDDLLTYLAIGARSAEDAEHRYIASGLDMPVGIKNGTSGDIAIGVNGVIAAQAEHRFAYRGKQVHSTGNPYAHLILRGGGGRSNYDPESIALADKLLRAKNIQNAAIVIDASHDNSLNGSGKDPTLQEMVIQTVMLGIQNNRKEYESVKGFMIESFIHEGKQSEKGPIYDTSGMSITDPCIGWDRTERLIRRIADTLDGLTP